MLLPQYYNDTNFGGVQNIKFLDTVEKKFLDTEELADSRNAITRIKTNRRMLILLNLYATASIILFKSYKSILFRKIESGLPRFLCISTTASFALLTLTFVISQIYISKVPFTFDPNFGKPEFHEIRKERIEKKIRLLYLTLDHCKNEKKYEYIKKLLDHYTDIKNLYKGQ